MTEKSIYWITGASSGIGHALAEKLAQSGHIIAVTARHDNALRTLHDRYPDYIIPCPGDITDHGGMHQIIASLLARGYTIHTAILNAGTYSPDDAASFNSPIFARTIDVNLSGTAHCLEAILPGMLAKGRGHIVIVSSVAGYRGLPRSIAYSASKAGLIAMAEAMAFDLVPRGIKVQIVCPGFVKTPLTDKNDFSMPSLMPVDDAVRAIIKGMEQNKFEIAFPRNFVLVMQGMKFLPWRLYYRIMARITGIGAKND